MTIGDIVGHIWGPTHAGPAMRTLTTLQKKRFITISKKGLVRITAAGLKAAKLQF